MKVYLNLLERFALAALIAMGLTRSAHAQELNDSFGGRSEPRKDSTFVHGGPGVGVLDPVENFDVSMSGYELVSASLKLESTNDVVKVLFTPWRLSHTYNKGFLENFKVNVARTKETTTLGLGSGWNNSHIRSERGQRLLDTLDARLVSITSGSANDDQLTSDAINEFYEQLAWNSRQVTAGVNFTLFDVLGGDQVDTDGDSLIDNYNVPLQGITGTITGTQNFMVLWDRQGSVSLSGFYSRLFDGMSEKFKSRVPRAGLTFTVTQLVLPFQSRSEYRKGKDYTSTLFIPGITLGFSYQFSKALDELDYVKDGIEESRTTTIFLDIRITPQSQFRLGVPLKTSTSIVGQEVAATRTFFQYSLALSDLSK
jgi:hypothetical protein